MLVPNNHGFPTKNDHFEAFWWYHHLRKHPYSWTWESISCERFCQSFLVMEDCNTAYLSKMRDSSMGDRFKPRSLFINFDHSEQETLWYSHYFHGHQPNSRGLHTHYKDSLLKVGWPSLLFHPSNWWRFAEMRAPVQQSTTFFICDPCTKTYAESFVAVRSFQQHGCLYMPVKNESTCLFQWVLNQSSFG